MPINEIILHVGMQKTATKSIQSTVFHKENTNFFTDKGLFIPWNYAEWAECPVNPNEVVYNLFSLKAISYQLNVRRGWKLDEIKKFNNKNISMLLNGCYDTKCDKLYISAEIFSLMSLKELEMVRKFFIDQFGNGVSFKIILVLRNPVSYAISKVQQYSNIYTSDYVYTMILNKEIENLFRNAVGNFTAVFGQDSLVVYNFEESLKHKLGPVGCHFGVLGFKDNEIEYFVLERQNQARSSEVIEVLSYFNEKSPPIIGGKLSLEHGRRPWIKKREFNDFSILLNEDIPGSKFTIDKFKMSELIDTSKNDILWLKETIGIDFSADVLNCLETADNHENTTWSEDTLIGFKNVFDKLPKNLKHLYTDFFVQKHKKTGDDKFLDLCSIT